MPSKFDAKKGNTIIRNHKELQNKTNYIEANPILWDEDDEICINI